MYTIILYRNGSSQKENGKKLDIERFRFTFDSMEQDGKLGLCEIKDGSRSEDLISKINLMTEGHNVWRLLYFEGIDKMHQEDSEEEEKTPQEDSEKEEKTPLEDSEKTKKVHRVCSEAYKELLEYYTGSGGTGVEVKCRCYPEEVWYLGWCEKQDVMGLKSKKCEERPPELVGNVYYFCMLALMESETTQRYSELMACCNLLILALNQFPIGFLAPGCPYYVASEFDRKKFAEYVNRQYSAIVEVEKLFTLESLRLQEQRRKGVPCPKYSRVQIEELDQNQPPKVSNLKRRIKWKKSEGDVEHALAQNSYEIRKWMHYPRGVMSGKVDKLEEELDKETLAGGFLSIAGKDLLERQLENALENLSIERREAMEQREFEKELRERENRIRKRTRKKLAWIQKLAMVLVAVFAEAPFLYYAFIMLLSFEENVYIGERGRVCLIIAATAGALLAIFLVPRVSFHHERKRYTDFLKKQMEDKAKCKRKYLQNTLECVAEYQYYVRLDREQQECEREWEQRNQNLGHHLVIWQQSKVAKLQLLYLLDKEEQEKIPDVKVDVDFGEEPQEIPYYWTAYKGSCHKTELNDSGFMMEAALEFIIRFRCVDNPAKVALMYP